mgnify:CR=1 FL=1
MDNPVRNRSLKVEALGWLDVARGRTLFPRIRLQGRWLTRAGFPPGARVQVIAAGQGRLSIVLQTGEAV